MGARTRSHHCVNTVNIDSMDVFVAGLPSEGVTMPGHHEYPFSAIRAVATLLYEGDLQQSTPGTQTVYLASCL